MSVLFNLKNEFNDISSVLDVGCGYDSVLKDVLSDKIDVFSVGTDICFNDLIVSRQKKIHNGYVCADIKKLCFKEKSFDVVLCMHVIEHLERDMGYEVIKMFEKIAKKKIIMGIPNKARTPSYYIEEGELRTGHRSYWSAKNLSSLGYKVIPTDGIKCFENINARRAFRKFFLVRKMIQMQEIICKFFPEISVNFIAIKNF